MRAAALNADASSDGATAMSASPQPKRLRAAPWKDVAFEQLTRFFALLVFSLLAGILLAGSILTLLLRRSPTLRDQ